LVQVWTFTLSSEVVFIIVDIVDIVVSIDNLFRSYISLNLMHWLVISRCILFLIVVLFCAVANQVSHLT
jgi:uncharacterized membrane protein